MFETALNLTLLICQVQGYQGYYTHFLQCKQNFKTKRGLDYTVACKLWRLVQGNWTIEDKNLFFLSIHTY